MVRAAEILEVEIVDVSRRQSFGAAGSGGDGY
jgi:hypothetical protein